MGFIGYTKICNNKVCGVSNKVRCTIVLLCIGGGNIQLSIGRANIQLSL